MKITSCVPRQMDNAKDKLQFIRDTIEKEQSDIFLTPQEFFGGKHMMPDKPIWKEEEIIPTIEDMSKETGSAIIIGAVIGTNQRLYFIDGKSKGYINKIACPSYALKWYGLESETNMDSRFRTFKLKNVNVAGFFCWEIFSDILMAGLGTLEPDFVFSAIKFGISYYPKLHPDKSIDKCLYCGGDIWKERLVMASKFELKCPIICSTNSWGLPKKSEALAGAIYPYDNLDSTIADGETIITNEIDASHVRGLREHKFSHKERTGEFPDFSTAKYTMMMKIHRLEKRLFGESQEEELFKKLRKIRYFQKRSNQ